MIWHRIKGWFKRIVSRFRPAGGGTIPTVEPPTVDLPPILSPSAAPIDPIITMLAAGITPPVDIELPKPVNPQPAQLGPKPNRKERRAAKSKWERERRKHDKFIEPKGEKPIKIERGPSPRPKTKPLPVIEKMTDDELIIVDEHHEGGKVMFKPDEFWGKFNFRDTILDQLDRYWLYLERMRMRDASSYGLYRQIGAQLLPFCTTGIEWSWTDPKADNFSLAGRPMPALPAWFRVTRPSFGCFAYAADSLTEKTEVAGKDAAGRKMGIAPRFMYFTKYEKPPPDVQPMSGGDIYKMAVWWDNPKQKGQYEKGGGSTDYCVFVDKTGERVQVLKVIDTKMIKIPKRKWDHHGAPGGFYNVPQRAWHIPDTFEDWAQEHGVHAEEYLKRLFIDAMIMHEKCHWSMLRIEVHKGDLTAVFGLDEHRIGYFFQDRDYDLTKTGHRKRIFHMVRAHERKDGHVVRFHFRGEREFEWAGYHVKISVPGRDYEPVVYFDPGAIDDYWIEPKDQKQYIDEPKMGEHMVQWMNQGVGKWKP